MAQAVTTDEFGPLAPKRIDTSPEAMFTIIIGMKNGETRSGPFSRRFLCESRSVAIPPIPEPIRTPKRVPSILPVSSAASWTAMADAAIA